LTTAFPALLEHIELTGATVTIDATGNQREIAQTILDKNAQRQSRLVARGCRGIRGGTEGPWIQRCKEQPA
jgi:hypothetical protein